MNGKEVLEIMDTEKIKKQVLRLSRIGQDASGAVNRVFGSPFMKKEQEETQKYFRECGLETWMDPAGNIHGVYEPAGREAPVLFAGSHMDSVMGGGMFDGTAGLVAAAECARRLQEEKVPSRWNIHILATNGEEGNELGGTFGSRVMMGMIDLDNEEWMGKAKKFGYSREELEGARLDVSHAGAYMELHIEQGLTLCGHHEKIGIVEGIVGLQRHWIRIRGKNNHAGTTMMEDRDDALVRAAGVILEADRLVRSYGHRMVATACRLELTPNAPAVINGRADILLEHRGLDSGLLRRYIEELTEKIGNPSVSVQPVVKKEPVQCSPALMNILEKVCGDSGVSCRRMPSGATHDGNAMASAMPIAMIFVPSRGGISHSREEWTDWDDLSCGVQVMYESFCRMMAEDPSSFRRTV